MCLGYLLYSPVERTISTYCLFSEPFSSFYWDINVIGKIKSTQSSVASEEEIESSENLEKGKVGVIKDSATNQAKLLSTFFVLKNVSILGVDYLDEITLVTFVFVAYESFKQVDWQEKLHLFILHQRIFWLSQQESPFKALLFCAGGIYSSW